MYNVDTISIYIEDKHYFYICVAIDKKEMWHIARN